MHNVIDQLIEKLVFHCDVTGDVYLMDKMFNSVLNLWKKVQLKQLIRHEAT